VTCVGLHRFRVSWRTSCELVTVRVGDDDNAQIGCGELSDTHDTAAAVSALERLRGDLVGRPSPRR